jgi:F-type H+-transporting ATPase subunit beta
MDGQIVLDRKIAELGIYPAINVFNSTSKLIDVEKIGEKPVTYAITEKGISYSLT